MCDFYVCNHGRMLKNIHYHSPSFSPFFYTFTRPSPFLCRDVFRRERLDRILVDHFLREGLYDAAKALVSSTPGLGISLNSSGSLLDCDTVVFDKRTYFCTHIPSFLYISIFCHTCCFALSFISLFLSLSLSLSPASLVNIDVFESSQNIERLLAQRQCEAALKWCHDNSSRLTKLKSTLEFKLRLQQFIEVSGSGSVIA